MTLIDTADVYGPHTNEELLGRALTGHHLSAADLDDLAAVPAPVGTRY